MHTGWLRSPLIGALAGSIHSTLEMKMKKYAVAFGMALLGLLSAPAHAVLVSLSPSLQTKTVNDSFSVDVNISGLGTEIVSAFDLNIYFNPAVLTGLSYTFGGGRGGAWDDTGSQTLSGSFDLQGFSLTFDPTKTQQQNDDDLALLQAPNSFTLATLTFQAFAAGVSQIEFGLGLNERDVVGREALFLTGLQFSNACVAANNPAGGNNVCAVSIPEPSSYGLVGLALIGLLVPSLRRRDV